MSRPARQLRVLVLSTCYPGRVGDLERRAERMRAAGHLVDLVRVEVRPPPPGRPLRARLPGYVRNHLTVLRAAGRRGRYDLVLGMSSPPLAAWPLALRRRLRGERLELVHHDIFPENAAVAGLSLPPALAAAARAIAHAAARAADAHHTLSPAMAATVRGIVGPAPPVSVAPLPEAQPIAGVARRDNLFLSEHGLADRFVAMYAGNLGLMYDFEPMIAAAEALRERRDVRFVIVGDGPQRPRVDAAARRLPNLQRVPRQPAERLGHVLCAADVHVVAVRRGAESVMWPSKLAELRALGLPVVEIGTDSPHAIEASELVPELIRRAAAPSPARVNHAAGARN